MDEGHTSKDSGCEYQNRRQGPVLLKHLEGNFKGQYTKRHVVDQVNCSDNSIIPMMARNMSTNQKCLGGFKKMSILSFSNNILLWYLRTSHLMDNFMLLEISLKVMIDKFSTIV
ncbi:unnamed protein product [Prunus armeniaca]